MRIVGGYAGDGPTVLGGDWNMTHGGDPDAQDYVPTGMFRKGDGDVQHVGLERPLRFHQYRAVME